MILSSQEEVDSFPSQYCNTLCSLTISGSDITNLDSLYVLEKVGQLLIQYNPILSNIGGLTNLATLGGSCSSTGLLITGNNLLGNLNGLSSLTSVSGGVHIESNTMLWNLDGLSNVTAVGAFNEYSLQINNNASLENIDGLAGITQVAGGVTISGNPGLQNINGLHSLTRIGPSLVILGNDALSTLDGLSALKTVRGYVIIENNNALVSIAALSNLNTIGQWVTSSMSLAISYNDVLTNLNGLQGLDTIPGTLDIVSNASLADINGLSSIRAVWKEGSLNAGITIAKNASLRDISGLSGLTVIGNARGSYLQIESNPVLEEIDLQSLTRIQGNLATGLTIDGNAALRNIDGLGSLQEVTGGFSASVEITNNPSLQNIDGLSSLHRLTTAREQSLVITDNGTLDRFCGLFTLFNSKGIGCGSPECYNTGGVVIERNERNPTVEEIEAEGPCDDPASQPTNLVFSQVTSQGMRVTFNRAPTFASGYVVLMKAYGASAPEDVPQDGTTYRVGQVIGSSSIVVDAGSDTTFVVSGLMPSTPYYFDVFSWKATADGNDYLTINPLEGSRTTVGQSAFVAALSFTGVESEKMTVVNGGAQQGHYITLMKAYGYPSPNDVPVNGKNYNVGATVGSSTIIVNKGDGSPFTVTYLLPNTRYYFDVYSFDPVTLIYEPAPRQGSQSTAAEGSEARMLASEELLPYPNPVESNTSIPFRVVGPASTVNVVIYDLAGRQVDVLVSHSFEAGVHEASWDGADSEGKRVQPGMYVYSVRSEAGVVSGRLSVR
ncbi:MAG TPA: FlgD immunoglobulin-like domain containing protein [Cyclobacteriaceae bacterium]|nr:FlgD immunoglobulin-like domain containing protein [Cyclobacteriaceae bacterium]